MKKLLAILALSIIATAGVSAQGKKIGMRRAQAIASTHAKGLRLRAKELEHEGGQWIYSFEFRNRDGSTREVNINAYTGKLVGIERESPSKEKKEGKDEMKKVQ
ncbi:MAG TPA: PepSY domain-containing protein [Pyrinomonadaceae bacterium]